MLVKDLIEHLKTIPQGTPVLAKDIFGKPSTYIVLRCVPDGLAIDAIPEPDTQFYKHPFDPRTIDAVKFATETFSNDNERR